eukprot:647711_1
MGCLCCKSNKHVSNDTTNTALLNEPDITRTTPTFSNETNALLHVTAETDEVKPPPHIHDPHHTLPKQIPDIRQLQMIIFQAINYNDDYNLYPKHGKFSSIWNAQSIQKEQDIIYNQLFNLSLTIALYTNGANVAYLQNIHSLLDYSIRIHYNIVLLPELLHLITTFISGTMFSDDIIHQRHSKQLEFSYDNSIVTFKYMATDYLNIRSACPLVGHTILIHCYVVSKGDEMWIGLVNKKTYDITSQIERKYGSLLYYGGRETSIDNKLSYSTWDNGHGAIHGFSKVLKTVDVYRQSDWISFLIQNDKDAPNCKIFKNGTKIFDIDALPFKPKPMILKPSIMSSLFSKAKQYISAENDNDLDDTLMDENDINEEEEEIYFCVVVDDAMDSLLIEEALCTQQNINVTI